MDIQENRHSGAGKLFAGILIGIVLTVVLGFVFLYILGRVITEPDQEAGNSSTYATTTTQNGNGAVENYADPGKVNLDAVSEKVQALEEVVEYYYLNEYSATDLENGIYRGMLDELGDPYTVYFTPDEFTSFMESMNGSYCGIGVMVQQNPDTKVITIVRVFKTGPSAAAGVRAGDIIVAVDGTDVTSMMLDNVVSMIRGEEGTSVTVTLMRGDERTDYTMNRAVVEVDTVMYTMLDGGIGYVSVLEFDDVTDEQYSEALNDLLSQGMQSLIVDLRDNPGGSLDTVCNMVNRMVSGGTIVYTEDKYGNVQTETANDAESFDLPVAILVNGNSASASEVYTGAMRDHEKATVIGTTTFGKGIVQSLIPLNDGSAVKVTVSKYFTPSGVCIHGTGITPDIEVESEVISAFDMDGNLVTEGDAQLAEAIKVLTE